MRTLVDNEEDDDKEIIGGIKPKGSFRFFQSLRLSYSTKSNIQFNKDRRLKISRFFYNLFGHGAKKPASVFVKTPAFLAVFTALCSGVVFKKSQGFIKKH